VYRDSGPAPNIEDRFYERKRRFNALEVAQGPYMSNRNAFYNFQLTTAEVYPQDSIHGFGFSPDGKWISYVTERILGTKKGSKVFEKDSLSDLFILPSIGGYPRQLTTLGDVRSGGVWSQHSNQLCLVRSGSLDILHLADSHVEVAYKSSIYVGKSEFGDQYLRLPRWRPGDGNFIVFVIRESTRAILRMASSDGTFQHDLFSVQGWITSWDWSPDGHKLIVVVRNQNGLDCDICLIQVESGGTTHSRTLWTEPSFKYCQPIAVWAPDGSHIIYRSNKTGWAKLWVRQVDSETARPITEGSWDDYAFRFSPDGEEIVYASTQCCDGGGDHLWISPVLGGPARRLPPHLGVNAPLHWSRDNRIYYWHSSPTEVGDLFSVHVDAVEPERFTWSIPLTLESKLRSPLQVSLVRDDGSSLPILLFMPKDFDEGSGQKLPAIVWIRGGPTGDSFRYRPINQWLANEGFLVVSPHYRGSTGRGVAYMEAVTGEGVGRGDLNDIIVTANHVKGLPFVDLERGIGIGGHSWGGYLTLMAATTFPREFSCAVAGSAIVDWSIQQSQTEVRHFDRWLLDGWEYKKRDLAKSRSPIEYVDQISIPLFLYHGKADRDVPYAQCEAFLDRALKKGIPIEERRYDYEGHVLANQDNQCDCLAHISAFFRSHLQSWNFSDNPSSQQVE